jgi:cytochrome-b5 reductase
VSRDVLASFIPPPQLGAKGKVLVCGPPGFMKSVSGDKKSPSDQGELEGILKTMHYAPEQVFKF